MSYQHGGTGLSLALSRALAELMLRSLTVRSLPGQGAVFTLDLPLPEPQAAGSCRWLSENAVFWRRQVASGSEMR